VVVPFEGDVSVGGRNVHYFPVGNHKYYKRIANCSCICFFLKCRTCLCCILLIGTFFPLINKNLVKKFNKYVISLIFNFKF
jgi:hypothetical protein